MRVMLTNDDGIHAPGIVALHAALTGRGTGFEPIGDVAVIAPETVQSATSHGVTFDRVLRTRQVRVGGAYTGTSVDGRPADCVKLGLTSLWPERFGAGERPDLVVSGMNAGANVGINVIYSGTVAAAIEAAFLGVPSIAVSLHLFEGEPDFTRAAGVARQVIDRLIADGLPRPHECLSVNIPRVEVGEDVTPDPDDLAVCPVNVHALNDRYERRESPSGEPYYWPAGHGLDFANADDGTDVHELFERRITVTPLRYDLTAHQGLEYWRKRLGSR